MPARVCFQIHMTLKHTNLTRQGHSTVRREHLSHLIPQNVWLVFLRLVATKRLVGGRGEIEGAIAHVCV
jgi:hypothetical protein